MSFISELNKFDDFDYGKGISNELIMQAEIKLGVKFSKDYKEYLQQYGIGSANGCEFTGICKSDRLNVVSATIKERDKSRYDLSNLYVIENLHIDKSIAWQSTDGAVYMTVGKGAPEKICNNISDYLKDNY